MQALHFILQHTNLNHYIPCFAHRVTVHGTEVVRATSSSDNKNTRHGHLRHCFLNSEAGLAILDRNFFVEGTDKSSDERIKIVKQLAQSDYDLLVIDEFSENATPKLINELVVGKVYDSTSVWGNVGSPKTRYSMTWNFSMMLFVCGVFFRRDSKAGSLMSTINVINRPLNCMDLIKNRLIAHVRYIVVALPVESDPCVALDKIKNGLCEYSVNHRVHGNSFDATKKVLGCVGGFKLMALDAIIKFHSVLNHKIMIFCQYLCIVKIIKMLYKDAVVIENDSTESDREEAYANFGTINSGTDVIITTSIGGVGFDQPLCQVVISIAAHDSPSASRQNLGRAERDCPVLCAAHTAKAAYAYDFIVDETLVPRRFDLFKVDGVEANIEVVEFPTLLDRLGEASTRAMDYANNALPDQAMVAQLLPSPMESQEHRATVMFKTLLEMMKPKRKQKVKSAEDTDQPSASVASSKSSSKNAGGTSKLFKEREEKRRKAQRGVEKEQKRQDNKSRTSSVTQREIERDVEKTQTQQDSKSQTSSATGAIHPSTAAGAAAPQPPTATAMVLSCPDDLNGIDDKLVGLMKQLAPLTGISPCQPDYAVVDQLKKKLDDLENVYLDVCTSRRKTAHFITKTLPEGPNGPWQAHAPMFYV
tara:strand:+ start:18 stop:1955 length:1938 start_codon:yes stop_codon:yes gene_type:complete